MPDITGYCISRLFTTVMQQFVVFATFSYHRIRNFGRVVEAKNSVPLSMGTNGADRASGATGYSPRVAGFVLSEAKARGAEEGFLTQAYIQPGSFIASEFPRVRCTGSPVSEKNPSRRPGE